MFYVTIAVIILCYIAAEAIICFWKDQSDPYGSITDKPSRNSTNTQPKFYKD